LIAALVAAVPRGARRREKRVVFIVIRLLTPIALLLYGSNDGILVFLEVTGWNPFPVAQIFNER